MQVTVGTILRGKYKNNIDQRALVWAFNPNNPMRVVLWLKSGRYSWNFLESLDSNYERAPADEPPFAAPTKAPPPDPLDRDRKPEATPVEIAASTPAAPANDAPALQPEPEPPAAPPPPEAPANTAANDDGTEVRIVLRGPSAEAFRRKVSILNNVARVTGGQPMSAADLVSVAVDNFVAGLIGGAA